MLSTGAPARADLSDDAERVVRVWSSRGARVERLPPIFVEHGRVKALSLEKWVSRPAGASASAPGNGASAGAPGSGASASAPGSSASASAPGSSASASAAPGSAAGQGSSGCLTIALIAHRTAEFLVDNDETARALGTLPGMSPRRGAPGTLPPAPDASEDGRVKSTGGAITLTRCGADRVDMKQILVDLSSSRATIELVVAESRDRPGDVREVLPERAFGPIAPRGDPGRPLEPGPLPERLTRAERRARADGAESVVRSTMRASIMGSGEFSIRLAEGCHRLELMAEVPAVVPRRATDVDAEVREAESGRSLGKDRADSPDARLDFCLGETTVVEVPFVGAAGPVPVFVSDARWPTPRMVPSYYGARARGGLAMALRRRGAPAPREGTIFETLGVQGETVVPFEVEPGRCYLAAATVIRGDARGMRLTAELGGRVFRDEVGERPEGTAITFCSEGDTSALMRVEARGNAPWWVLVVWPMN